MPGVRLRTDHARGVALDRFDLDDVGAHVAQRLRRERAEHDGGDVDDADAGERAGWLLSRCFLLGVVGQLHHAARIGNGRRMRRAVGPGWHRGVSIGSRDWTGGPYGVRAGESEAVQRIPERRIVVSRTLKPCC